MKKKKLKRIRREIIDGVKKLASAGDSQGLAVLYTGMGVLVEGMEAGAPDPTPKTAQELLGKDLKDPITGFKGRCTSVTFQDSGCIVATLRGKGASDLFGKPPEYDCDIRDLFPKFKVSPTDLKKPLGWEVKHEHTGITGKVISVEEIQYGNVHFTMWPKGTDPKTGKPWPAIVGRASEFTNLDGTPLALDPTPSSPMSVPTWSDESSDAEE